MRLSTSSTSTGSSTTRRDGLFEGQLTTPLSSEGRRGPRRRKLVLTSKCKSCAQSSSAKGTFPRKWRQPREDYFHCHDHGHFSKMGTSSSRSMAAYLLMMLIAMWLFAVFSVSAVSGVPTHSSATMTFADQFGSRLLAHNSPQSDPHEPGAGEGHHRMSPSLKSFSNLNEDLMFEDSVDVETSHYQDDQQASASVTVPANSSARPVHSLEEESPPLYKPTRMRVDHGGESFSQVERVALEPSNHPLREQMAAQYRHMSERIRRFDSLTAHFPSPLDAHKSALSQLVSNHLSPEPVTDLAPRGQPQEPKVNRDSILLPKRLDLSRLDVIGGSELAENGIAGHRGDSPVWPANSSSTEQHSIAGDHILRPFFRKQKRHQPKRAMFGKVLRNKANFRHPLDWSVPVVDLKRITDHARTSSPEAIFNKRLPLMGNEEGFILTRPNSSLQNRDMPVERRMDRVNSLPNLHNEFKRRFGDLSHEPNSNHAGGPGSESNHQSGRAPHANNFNPNDPFRMGYLMDDISMNDLDLDDIGPSRMPKNFKPRKPPVRSKPSPNGPPFEAGPGPTENAPPGQPIAQIMPLFFDKFLSEFGNSNPRMTPEGFSLPPPNQGKFGPFDPTPPVPSPPGVHLTPPNHMDGDIGDLDAPNQVDRRLINGNLHKVKPEIGPPLFNNDILPPNEFDNEFGPWPKIFRFTDGRINLHDFEREKKRSRVKFSQKMGKSQALYNIKRESFLILHGGTFTQ